jgi:hypothetical protein
MGTSFCDNRADTRVFDVNGEQKSKPKVAITTSMNVIYSARDIK